MALLSYVLKKRKESQSARNGFLAGLSVGFANAVYTLITTIMFKDETVKGLKEATESYSTFINADTVYGITLVVLPVVVTLLLTVAGIFMGILIRKLKNTNRGTILAAGTGIGALYGLSMTAPVQQLTSANIIVGTATGIFYVLLYLLFEKKSIEL